MTTAILSFLVISLSILNLFLGFLLKKERKQALERKPDKTAQEILADLFKTGAYIHIERLDPRDFFIRVER